MSNQLMPYGVNMILREREEQLNKHGFTLKDFDQYYQSGELKSAAMYCLTGDKKYYPENWGNWFREKIRDKRGRMTDLEFDIEMTTLSGAFCAAHIDLLNSKRDNPHE